MTKDVYALDEGFGCVYSFIADSAAEAMCKMRYLLDINTPDPNPHMETVGNGRTLTMTHHDALYACLND